jgi:hypothetical protein
VGQCHAYTNRVYPCSAGDRIFSGMQDFRNLSFCRFLQSFRRELGLFAL